MSWDEQFATTDSQSWNYEAATPFRPPHEIAELDFSMTEESDETSDRSQFAGEEWETGDRPTLRRGSRGDPVRELQRALARVGHAVTADGIFGPGTEAAVRAYQAANGLTADGVVGAMTWARLEGGGSGGGPATPPSTSSSSSSTATDVPTQSLGMLVLSEPGHSFSYAFTRDDLIWTAKLIVHEAGGREDPESAAVLWAMFNHYAFFRHKSYSTLTSFIRAYSTTLQPVLLNWRAAARHYQNPSSRFVRSGGYYSKAPQIPKGQLQRHLDIQAAPWSSIKASARRLATRALRGELPNPGIGNANEFASTKVLYYHAHNKTNPTREQWRQYTEGYARRKKLEWIGEVAGLDQLKNAFFITASIANVPAGAVRIDPPVTAGQEAEAWSAAGEDFAADESFEGFEESWELDPQFECEGCLGEEELEPATEGEDLDEVPAEGMQLEDEFSDEALYSEAAFKSEPD
jgi:hypothetical protein